MDRWDLISPAPPEPPMSRTAEVVLASTGRICGFSPQGVSPEHTVMALEYLVENSILSQVWFLKEDPLAKYFTDSWPDSGFVKSFCVVRFSGARRIGHTTALAAVGKEYFEKPLWLFMNMVQATRAAKEHDLSQKDVSSVESHQWRGSRHDAILVDGASYVKDLEERVKDWSAMGMEYLSEKKPFCIILAQ